MIADGQSLGLKYDALLISNGFELQGTDQMWDSEMGNSGVCRRLLDGVKAQGYTKFAVHVQDLGNGFCSMGVYV
ncbi:hypothetical protein NSB31_29875, partial [Bacillus cereus]|uniref:hypothetical protein n=1 Tax=Bacillus cereus TaxID=1396 RepID=UPI002149EE64